MNPRITNEENTEITVADALTCGIAAELDAPITTVCEPNGEVKKSVYLDGRAYTADEIKALIAKVNG